MGNGFISGECIAPPELIQEFDLLEAAIIKNDKSAISESTLAVNSAINAMRGSSKKNLRRLLGLMLQESNQIQKRLLIEAIQRDAAQGS